MNTTGPSAALRRMRNSFSWIGAKNGLEHLADPGVTAHRPHRDVRVLAVVGEEGQRRVEVHRDERIEEGLDDLSGSSAESVIWTPRDAATDTGTAVVWHDL